MTSQNSNKFIKFIPSEKSSWLMQKYPFAFLLLCLIAQRARRSSGSPDGLEIGEAQIGDHRAIGASEQQYRTAKDVLCRIHAITICETCRTRKKSTTGSTTVGTKVKILSSEYWDINPDIVNDQVNDRPTTDQRPTNDEQEVKKVKKVKKVKEVKSEQKEKITTFTFSPPSDKKEDHLDSEEVDYVTSLSIFCSENNLMIADLCLKRWFKKGFSVSYVLYHLEILKKRTHVPIHEHEKWMEGGLRDNFMKQDNNFEDNKKYAQGVKIKHSWDDLQITLLYAAIKSTGKDYYFHLPAEVFQDELFKAYQTQQQVL